MRWVPSSEGGPRPFAVARCKPTATLLLGKPRGRSCCVAASKQKQICREIKSPWEMGPQRASVKAEQLRSAKAPQILFASALASGIGVLQRYTDWAAASAMP